MIKKAIKYTIQKDRNRMKLKTKKDMFKISSKQISDFMNSFNKL